MWDKFRAMNAFLAVVDAGTFVGGADATAQSKAAVSKQIAELESRLGVRLLHRTTRRLSLTTAGEVYYLRCKDVLASLRDAESEITDQTSQAHGRLRIGVPQDFGLRHLTPLWGPFMQQNPRLQLDVNLTDRTVDLVEEGYDMVVRIGNLPDSTLVARPLAQSGVTLCAAPSYLQAHGYPQTPDDLAEHCLLSYSYLATGNEWRLVDPSGQPSTLRIQPRMQVNSGETCRRLALAGHGITRQPDFMLYEDLREGRLIELLPEWRNHPLPIYAAYPTRTLMPVKVRRLSDFLAQALSNPAWALPASAAQAARQEGTG